MWTKEQIRLARKINLPPLLRQRNYRLHQIDTDNYKIVPDPSAPQELLNGGGNTGKMPERTCPDTEPSPPRYGTGIIVKNNFWIWPDNDLSGNTIDFFMTIEGMSFNQAMQIIIREHSLAQN